MAKLGEICRMIADGDWIETKDQSGDGIRLIQTGNIGNGQYLDKPEKAKYITLETFNRLQCKAVLPGDILISRLPDPVGRACEVPQNIGQAITAVDCTIVRLNSSICNDRYFLNYTQSQRYFHELQTYLAGTTRTRISRKNLEKIEVPLPSLDEQRHIAAVLDKVTDLIAQRRAQLDKLDLLVKSRFVEMFGEPGTNEKGWGMAPLGSICQINPKKGKEQRLVSGLQVSFVPMTAVTETGEIDVSETKMYDDVKTGFTYFAENDVLFAKITPCMENGKGAIAKGLCNGIGFGSTEFHVLRPISGKTNPYWIYTLTAFSNFRLDAAGNMTGSAGQRRVPASFLENYKVSVPPIGEQNQFELFVQKCISAKTDIKCSLQKAELLKNALMQRYFSR